MLSSWGSSNYRPSAPFLYEVASHVKKLPFRRLLLLLLLCGADLLFRADNFVNQIVGVVRIRRDTTVASDWLMWIVAGKGILRITRGMAGCMHARHQRMHACALCRMQRDTRMHARTRNMHHRRSAHSVDNYKRRHRRNGHGRHCRLNQWFST